MSPTTSTSPTTSPTIPTGWRAETWHGVTLNVPDSWGYGDIHGCWHDAATPLVERPDGGHRACLRAGWGYGVAFLPPSAGRPSNAPIEVDPVDHHATVHMVQTNGAIVIIVTKDKETADAIAASVRTYDGLDPNGCPATAEYPSVGASRSSPVDVGAIRRPCAATPS